MGPQQISGDTFLTVSLEVS